MVRRIGQWILIFLFVFMIYEREADANEVPKIYQLVCEEADGKNGYYICAPEIIVKHFEENLITRIQINYPDGRKWKEILTDAFQEKAVPQGIFTEGEYCLNIWMEEKSGKVISGTEYEKDFKVDMLGPNPIEFIDSGEGEVELIATDATSGVEGIYYQLGNGEKHYAKGAHVLVTLPINFKGKITAYAVDRAGNVGEKWESQEFGGDAKKSEANNGAPMGSAINNNVDTGEQAETKEDNKGTAIVTDITIPTVEIQGILNSMIVNYDVKFSISVNDDSELEMVKGEVLWKKPDGSQKIVHISEWEKDGKTYRANSELSQEGTHHLTIEAIDIAGNVCKKSCKVIIDKTKPVLAMIPELEDGVLHSFQWKYDIEELVTDFTTYVYEMRMDGVLCDEKIIYSEAGMHVLELKVTDAAGNVSEKRIEFLISENRAIEENGEETLEEFIWILSLFILFAMGIGGICWAILKKEPLEREEAR